MRADDTCIASGGGDISLLGYGGGLGVHADYSDLDSSGGAIVVRGEGGTGNGIELSALVASGGGNITMQGTSTDAVGLVFGDGYYGGMTSSGGDILLQGQGATGGVAVYAGSFGSSEIDSAGGAIDVDGTASAAGAIGVRVDGVDLRVHRVDRAGPAEVRVWRKDHAVRLRPQRTLRPCRNRRKTGRE